MMIQELRNEVKRLQTKLRTSSTKDDPDDLSTPLFTGNGKGAYPNLYHLQNPNDMESYNMMAGVNHKRDRPELKALKTEITAMFDEEFRLRHDLLKLDGAMLQSALDCEILRLMVLDWENLKTGNNSDGEGKT